MHRPAASHFLMLFALGVSIAGGVGRARAENTTHKTHAGHTATAQSCQRCQDPGADCHTHHGLLSRLRGLCCWPGCFGWLGWGHYGDPWANCNCNGSYKFPVPPQYTYHWPGMYQQQLMTDYHDPYRFPPLKPYYDEPAPGEAMPYPGLEIDEGLLGPPGLQGYPSPHTQSPEPQSQGTTDPSHPAAAPPTGQPEEAPESTEQ